ncbi:MAG TPA: serine protease [Myxococcota bacterium]|nr:serine protease [Myxococcota bacterium]
MFHKGLRLLGVLACAGCTPAAPNARPPTQLHAVAWYDRFNEVLEGTIDYDPALHLGFLDLTGRVNGMRCVGQVRVVQLAPAASKGVASCNGAKGIGEAECSDGRQITAHWSSERGCGEGSGKGKDSVGAELHFVYGMNPQQQETVVADALHQQGRKPLLPAPPPPGTSETAAREPLTGTAFFVTRDGKLVTNHHVVAGAGKIEVALNEEEVLEARLLHDDPINDLAILEVDAVRAPLRLRSEHGLAKGDAVFTLGFPVPDLQGPEAKVTFGHVNALSGIAGDPRYVQIDVPTQPGNSGGPLFNQRGEVVGVVSATLDPRQTMNTAGYIPQNVNYALKGEVVYAMLRENLPALPPPTHARRGAAPAVQELVTRAEESVVRVIVR